VSYREQACCRRKTPQEKWQSILSLAAIATKGMLSMAVGQEQATVQVAQEWKGIDEHKNR
jgi:hypothetical protein